MRDMYTFRIYVSKCSGLMVVYQQYLSREAPTKVVVL